MNFQVTFKVRNLGKNDPTLVKNVKLANKPEDVVLWEVPEEERGVIHIYVL